MIKLGSLVKLMKGGIGQDELEEILAIAGMNLTFAAVKPDLDAFRPLATAASLPGSKLVELKGNMKDGSQIHALLVINQASEQL
jgi:hypothetical protein